MIRRGRARVATLVALSAITLVVPAVAARGDLLGGLTDLVDDTVDTLDETVDMTADSGTDLVDDSVDLTTDLVDGTVGDTGTFLDDPVDSLTDSVDATAGGITQAVDGATDAVTDALAEGTDAVTDTIDDGAESLVDQNEATVDGGRAQPPPTTTTIPPSSTPPSASPSGDSTAPATSVASTVNGVGEPSDEHDTAMVITDRGRRGDGDATGGDGLTVLSAAGGLSDPSVLEPVHVMPLDDDSLYGRLLDWLSGAGVGFLGLLAGPILALEILIRALLSAGSGLVAPASLLGSYLARLLWESRGARPRPATA